MIAPIPLVKVLKKSAGLVQATCITLIPLSIFGCNPPEPEHLIIKDLKEKVSNFYESKSLTELLRIKTVLAGKELEGFCVLGAYEGRVTPDSDKVIPVNDFLGKYRLVGQENYWHLIVKTSDGLRFVRFNTAKTPLISPRPAYEGKNCVATRSIIFSKKSVLIGGAPLLGGGGNKKIVINVQPGD
ncbi:hypothetical protein [Sterolibacterium denitrificans]|uniref:hypothetical protein n=1 Tax=Sterolibacterium denitrificans TaxID=157592 RepID=UPI0012B6914B|nr:hypothetical protein [Sterolibacterium denitrificans]